MKILFVYHYIAHYRLPVFKELSSSKLITAYFAAGETTDCNIKIIDSTDLEYIKLNNFWIWKKKYLWQSGLFRLLFKGFDEFVLLGSPYFISTWFFLFYCFLIKKKASIWTHGVTEDLSFLKKAIFRLLWSLSNKIYVYGNYAKNKIIEYGIDENKVVVIFNSLDYNKQLSIRNELSYNSVLLNYFLNNWPTVIFTGRLSHVKRLDLALEAMKLLFQQRIFFNFVILGTGQEEEELKLLASKFNIVRHVWFYGACYDEKTIGNLFYNSRACVSPGNVGLTAIHSLSYGTPVITHSDFGNQMPEFEAIEDGVTGSFFHRNNVVDLSKAIKYWVTMEAEAFEKRRTLCYQSVDIIYNPINQVRIFEKSFINGDSI